jgi:hypothetical protein
MQGLALSIAIEEDGKEFLFQFLQTPSHQEGPF